MEPTTIESVALEGSVAAMDMSMWSLFLRADVIVQLVVLVLVVASFWCWAIIFEKVRRIRRLKADAVSFEDAFWAGGSLE